MLLLSALKRAWRYTKRRKWGQRAKIVISSIARKQASEKTSTIHGAIPDSPLHLDNLSLISGTIIRDFSEGSQRNFRLACAGRGTPSALQGVAKRSATRSEEHTSE